MWRRSCFIFARRSPFLTWSDRVDRLQISQGKRRLWPVTCDMSSYLKLLTASTNCCTLPREINVRTVTLVNRDFYPMRKNVCFWCIFGCWFQICFPNFSITHNFRSRLKAWIICARTLRSVFTVGAMKYSRISSLRKMVICFAMMFDPLWKFLVMNITQISGDCSLISEKWAGRWFYSTTERDSLPILWLMQPKWREVMKAWSCWCERLSISNWSGSYLVIWRL